MKNHPAFITALFVLTCGTLFAQTQSKLEAQAVTNHPIDVEIADCYNQRPTMMGMIECEIEGFNKWNKEMEKTYDQLMTQLTEPQRLVLKDQQLAWTQYRDLLFEFFEKVYGDKVPILASNRTDVVRKRALELKSHLELLNKK